MPQQHVIPIEIVSSMISASIWTTKGSIVRPVVDRVEKRSLCSLIVVKKKKKRKKDWADIFTPLSMKTAHEANSQLR